MCSVFDLVEFDEKLGDFALFEDEELLYGAELFEFGPDDVVSDLEDNGVVDADEQHLGGLFVLGGVPDFVLAVHADKYIYKNDESHYHTPPSEI